LGQPGRNVTARSVAASKEFVIDREDHVVQGSRPDVDGDEPVIMHAMPLRASLYRCLDGR